MNTEQQLKEQEHEMQAVMMSNGASNGTENMPFAVLLESYSPEALRRGQIIEGEIIKIDDNVLYANVGAKRTAVIPPQDLENIDEAYLKSISIGDTVPLYVTRTPLGEDELIVSLQRGLQQKNWEDAEKYLESGELIELDVSAYNKGGLLVPFGYVRGFIPNSHVPELQHTRDRSTRTSIKAKMVGRTLPLKVIEVDRQRRRLVLSARAAQKEARQKRLQELEENTTIVGTVTSIADFGAFVDLGGVDGLIHISNLEWRPVNHPSDVVSVGEEVEVLIESVDVERERVSLNRKAMLPNPWQLFEQEYDVGDLLQGVVTNVVDFGAFVLLPKDIEGLLHISEMRIYGDSQPQDVLQPGDVILARIISMEPEEERLGLSQRRVTTWEEMEWMQRRTAAAPIEESDEAEAGESELAADEPAEVDLDETTTEVTEEATASAEEDTTVSEPTE